MSDQKAESIDEVAQRLRDIWSLDEGPGVETALYKYGTCEPSPSTTFAVDSWAEVLSAFHKKNIDDQFVPPIVRVDDKGQPIGTVKADDSIIYFDFRTDRAKPLSASFLDIPYGGQDGGLSDKAKALRPKVTLVTMTHYDDNFNKSPALKEAFNPAEPLEDTYTEFMGKAGISQLITAESEKWRAVTWFKDGRRNLGYGKDFEKDLIRQDKHPSLPITVKIVKSRAVAAHIQAPQMRAKEIADVLIQGVEDNVQDIFANFANADMVGHAMTDFKWFDGVRDAILELDTQLGRVVPKALAAGYTVIITADHGNAEQMQHPDGKANPAHTTNKVPCIFLGLDDEEKATIRDDATIGDIGPTVCHLRGMKQPDAWDRKSMLVGDVKANKERKVMRLVLDGYGVREDKDANAMAAAAEKKGSALHMDAWMGGKDNAVAKPVEASGPECGYLKGAAGTTEFGHVLFDAGRTVHSDVSLIDHAMSVGKFDSNKAFVDTINDVKANGRTLHIMGIVSDGGVHSSLAHLEGLLRVAAAQGLKRDQVSIHFISDGRDVKGDSSPQYVKWLEEKMEQHGVGQINSIWGRGWGKDRDNRWLRIETAFLSLVSGSGAVHVQLKK